MSSELHNRSKPEHPEPALDRPMSYQIRLRDQIDAGWTDWFEGLTVTQAENGDTLLTGLIVDQAALHGLLKKVRDLGMPLVSVNPVRFSGSQEEPGETGTGGA
jgi:hypothetical protein